MKDWIKNIFDKKEAKEILKWEQNNSILKFLKENIDADGSLKEAANTLPDEKKADDEIKFAPGLMDSMLGSDDSDESKTRIKTLFRLLSKIAKTGDPQSKSDFYSEITANDSVIGIIDQFLQKIAQSTLPIDPHLFNYANALATKTNDRNAVKFGIAILGFCQNKKPVADIKILGLHDEFTVFSTIALFNLSDNLIQDLWQLAKQVDGWGKIQLVDRLADMALTDEIRDWLVLEGYKNSIMYEYLALTCAISGKLNDKLLEDTIDQALFKSTGEIIIALMDEGPAAGMSAYDDASEVIQNYVRHARKQALTITDFITLHSIKAYLEDSPEANETLTKWDENELADCLIDIFQILKSKDWTEEVKVALNSANNNTFWNGKSAAQKLDIDISETLWKRLDTHPFDFTSWYDITTYIDLVDPQKVVDKAIQLIPLQEISTGPAESMGIGPDFQKHQSLDCVITFLEDHPAIGEEIILAGLRSPVIRNRNMTLNTLEKWTVENWSDKIVTELNKLKEIEPADDTKENVSRLLKGEELE